VERPDLAGIKEREFVVTEDQSPQRVCVSLPPTVSSSDSRAKKS